MKASVARKYGWRPIVSEAQAAVLMRRELKRLRSRAQRREAKKEEVWRYDASYNYERLLNIKVGSWFKFVPKFDGRPVLSLLCDVVDDEKSPVSQSE